MLAPQLLGVQMRIVGDQLVGGAQDASAAAVVLLQLDHSQARPVFAELIDVFRVGAAPGVDRLIVVAHAGEVAAFAGERFQQAVLRVVGVLVFVHQQITQAFAPGVTASSSLSSMRSGRRIRSSKSTALNAARRC